MICIGSPSKQISINQLNQSYKVSLLSVTILLFFRFLCIITCLPSYPNQSMYILPCSIWKFMWEKVDVLLLSRRREKVISYFIKYVDEMDALSFAWDTTQWCFQYLFLGMSNNNHPHTGCSLLASSRRWYKKRGRRVSEERYTSCDKKIPTAAQKITINCGLVLSMYFTYSKAF